MNDWGNTKNVAGVGDGNYRSILGYAGESLVIGRALVAGYNLFFKAWRDSKYDAVMDVSGSLLRIEIKQTGDGSQVSVTSGGRSGAQISRSANSREQVLSTADCDFLIAIHSLSGKCWIVPTEVVELRNQHSISTKALDLYAERWEVFMNLPTGITLNDLRIGFRKRDLSELVSLSQTLGINEAPTLSYLFPPRTRRVLHKYEDWYALKIWEAIFTNVAPNHGK